MTTTLKEGDLVFLGDTLAGRAAKTITIEGRSLKWVYLPKDWLTKADPLRPEPIAPPEVYLELIFQRGTIQIWEARVYGPTEDGLWMGDLLSPNEAAPSASPAGMVAAIDLVMRVLPENSMEADQLKHIRSFCKYHAERDETHSRG